MLRRFFCSASPYTWLLLDALASSVDDIRAIVLVDPVTEWREVVIAALAANNRVISLQMTNATPQFAKFLPTSDQLVAAGVSYTLMMNQRDVFDSIRQLQLLSMEHHVDIAAIILLSEVAVEVSDIIAVGLKLPHNPLDLITARRDKGIMKQAVASRGLRVAKYSRVKSMDQVLAVMEKLAMSFPVVVKGFLECLAVMCSYVRVQMKQAMRSIQ